jgi:hypothetical protein
LPGNHLKLLNNLFWPGQGYYFPNLKSFEQVKVKAEIEEALNLDLSIPPWKELYLDAINYFTIGKWFPPKP